MHLSNRLMLALFCGVAAVSIAFAAYQVQAEMHALSDEVQRQAVVLAYSQQRMVEHTFQTGSQQELQALVDQYRNREHLAGMALYDGAGRAVAMTSGLAPSADPAPPAVAGAMKTGRATEQYFRSPGKRMHVFALPVSRDGRTIGAIAVFHNVAFLSAPVWRHALTSVAETLLIVGITLLIMHWSLGRPLRHMAQWLRDLRTGDGIGDGRPPKERIFRPLASELTK